MYIQCVRWCMETCTWREDIAMKIDTTSLTRLQLCDKEKNVFIPYCTSRMGLNDDYAVIKADTPVKWIAVFCTREDKTDLPYHAHQFPFPFNLPLYPQRDLYFCMYTELQGAGTGQSVPFTLGRDTQHPGQVGTAGTTILPLKLDTWQAYCTKIKDDRNLDVYATLQAAFDTQWAAEDADDDDFVADEEVATDLLLLQQIPGSTATTTGASAAGTAAVAADDDWNEDDAIVDALTGFVVEPQNAIISDDEIESTENSSEEDENDDAEEEDDDEEADDECIDEDDGAVVINLL